MDAGSESSNSTRRMGADSERQSLPRCTNRSRGQTRSAPFRPASRRDPAITHRRPVPRGLAHQLPSRHRRFAQHHRQPHLGNQHALRARPRGQMARAPLPRRRRRTAADQDRGRDGDSLSLAGLACVLRRGFEPGGRRGAGRPERGQARTQPTRPDPLRQGADRRAGAGLAGSGTGGPGWRPPSSSCSCSVFAQARHSRSVGTTSTLTHARSSSPTRSSVNATVCDSAPPRHRSRARPGNARGSSPLAAWSTTAPGPSAHSGRADVVRP